MSEADIRASAEGMAKNLKSHGSEYVVVDMGWYIRNHSGKANAKNSNYSLNRFGRFAEFASGGPGSSRFDSLQDCRVGGEMEFALGGEARRRP